MIALYRTYSIRRIEYDGYGYDVGFDLQGSDIKYIKDREVYPGRLIQYRAGRSHQPHRPLGKYREKWYPAQPSSCLQLSNLIPPCVLSNMEEG